jgi:hypothetical protein
VTVHAKDTLRRPRISQILDLSLAIAALEAIRTKGLVARQDGQVFNLIPTITATVGAIVAYEGSVAQEQEVCIGIEESAARVATKAVDMPSVTGCGKDQSAGGYHVMEGNCIPSSKAFPSSRIFGSTVSTQ